MQMRTLAGVKGYYKAVYTDWIRANRYGTERDRLLTMTGILRLTETLRFIYGAGFDKVEREWRDEAIDEFYEDK